jgi:hypothetical protein
MSVPATESFPSPIPPPAALMNAFGQTVSVPGIGGGPGYTLVSYLASPVPNASRLDYVVLCHEEADDWQWTFRFPGSKFILKSVNGDPMAWVDYGGAGQIETQVEVLKGGSRRALLAMTQDVRAPGAQFTTIMASVGACAGSQMFALREICEVFRDYIIAAAGATGPNGIPARLLAAVLFMEVWARPKDGSPKALTIRGKLDGQTYTPRLDALYESFRRTVGSPVYRLHLHDIRDVELELIRGFLNNLLTGVLPGVPLTDGTYLHTGAKSLGVGQIAQTTAAMTTGKITWRDLNEIARAPILDGIDDDFRALTGSDFHELFNILRFPKTNIVCAARLLEKIKNRPHRFPAMSARDVLTNPRAIGVIATEYNRGAYDTPLASMKLNGNGTRAVKYVVAPSSLGLEHFFPDPVP